MHWMDLLVGFEDRHEARIGVSGEIRRFSIDLEKGDSAGV